MEYVWSVFTETESGTHVATFGNEVSAEEFAEDNCTDCFRRIVKHQLLNAEEVRSFQPKR